MKLEVTIAHKNVIEVELRVHIKSKLVEQKLLKYCKAKGKLISVDNRFLVDYSTFLDGGIRNRTRDIRVRSTNGKLEIIIKQGSFADASRIESNVNVDSSLQDLLTIMALLGYQKGVAAIRNITRYQVGEVEVAVTEVRSFSEPNKTHSTFAEFEILTEPGSETSAEKRLQVMLNQLDLETFSEKEWYEYVETLNKEANGVFEYKKADWKLINKLGR